MPDTNPIQEVLNVTVKTDQFKKGLDDLRSLWQSFAKDVGESNVGNVIGAGMFRGITTQLNDIKQLLVLISHDVSTNMEEMVDVAVTSLSKVTTAINQASLSISNVNQTINNAQNGGSGGKGGGKNSTGGFLGNIANLAKIHAEWQLIGKVIDGIYSLATTPFRLFEEGSEYLKRTQSDAVLLEAALLSSVKYSDDLAKNFALTKEATIAATRGLQDIVVNNPGLKLQDVQSTFKVISEGAGGRGGVDTLREMLDLTEKFTLMIRAAGVDVQVTRRLSTELRKAFSGDVPKDTALAAYMGITSTELEKMVKLGLENNNLAQVFGEHFKAISEQAKDSKTSFESIEENVDLMAERLSGAFTLAPLTAYQTELLDLLKIMRDMEKESNDPGWFSGLSSIFQTMRAEFRNWYTFKASLQNANKYIADSPGLGGIPGRADTAVRDANRKAEVRERLQFLGVDTGDSEPDTKNLSWSDVFKQADPLGILDKNVSRTGGNPNNTSKKAAPFDASEISTHMAQYREKLQEITVAFNKAKQAEDELVSSGQENKTKESFNVKAAAAGAVALSTVAYNNALKTLVKDHSREVADIHEKAKKNDELGKPEDQGTLDKVLHSAQIRFDNAKSELHRNYVSTTESLLAQEVTAERGASAEILSIKKANFEASMQMIKKEADYQIAIADYKVKLVSQGFGSGLYSQQDVLDSRRLSIDERKKALGVENESIVTEHLNAMYDTTAGTVDRTAADNKYKAAQADLSAKYLNLIQEIKELDLETYAIEQKTNQERIAFYQQIVSLANQYHQAQENLRFGGQQIADKAAGRTTDSSAHYAANNSIRNSEIASLQSLKEYNRVQLELNHNEEQQLRFKTEIAQLDSQIKNLQLSKVADTFARVGEIDSQNISPVLKDIRKRKVLNEARAGAMTPDEVNPINTALDGLNSKSLELGDAFSKLIFGTSDLLGAWHDAKTAGEKAAVVAEGIGGAIHTFGQFLSTFQQGMAQGGALGGTGAVLSQAGGIAKGFASNILKQAGPYAEAAGAVLSLIGGLFTAHAKHIVDNINKEFTATMQGLTNGQYGINQTLQAVMQERQQAISQLSGVKGGRDQLDKLLPQLDQQIAQLQQQQKQAIIDFNNQFDQLAMNMQQGNSVGSQILQNWTSVNQQVYTYVNATGDATKATQFLSMTLQQLQKTSQDQLNQGEQQSIQSAIQLNSQLLQRMQLIESINEQVFALQNADSTERSQAGSVTRAQQVQQLQRQSQQQLQDLNFQIDQSQAVVDAQSTVFDLSGDIYALHKRDTELVLSSLQTQITGYQQLKDIISSITEGADGLFGSSLNWLSPITNPVTYGQQLVLQSGAVNVTIYAGDNSDITDVTADSITQALNQAARSGSPIA